MKTKTLLGREEAATQKNISVLGVELKDFS
jgi:hypothetical protein